MPGIPLLSYRTSLRMVHSSPGGPYGGHSRGSGRRRTRVPCGRTQHPAHAASVRDRSVVRMKKWRWPSVSWPAMAITTGQPTPRWRRSSPRFKDALRQGEAVTLRGSAPGRSALSGHASAATRDRGSWRHSRPPGGPLTRRQGLETSSDRGRRRLCRQSCLVEGKFENRNLEKSMAASSNFPVFR